MLDNETRDAERLGVHDHAEHGHEMSSGQDEKVKLDKNPKYVSKMSIMLRFFDLLACDSEEETLGQHQVTLSGWFSSHHVFIFDRIQLSF